MTLVAWRKRWAGLVLPVACGVLVAAAAAESRNRIERPNVVVILSDDQGWGDLSIHGNRDLHTPNIDSLARSGASFDRFYVCPVCSPTRAEFLTGRYHPRSGVTSTTAGGERIDKDAITIADVFQAAGYATGAFGKWHNGTQFPYHPNARGFAEFYGFTSGHWGNYFSPPLDHNGRLVQGVGFVVNDFTDRALEFIELHQRRPFFVYLAYNTPHSPMQVPDRWWDRFKYRDLTMRRPDVQDEDVQHTRAALAMCENIDWNVGRILTRLDELQLAENTIVIYFSDNGPNGARWNGGMKGRKGSTDEGGVRSPLFVRWPREIASGVQVTEIGAAIDILPTLADLAGIELERPDQLDGLSLKAALTGESEVGDERTIFSHWQGRVSARNKRFRFDHDGQLFDMQNDPAQRNDVSALYPDTTRQMQRAVRQWKAEMLGRNQEQERPFPVGHPGSPFTQLPARDAKPHGGIRRSNRYPNCSYLTNWTSADDRITWDVDVITTGDYEVSVYYTCPPEDLGALIELSFQEARVAAKISEAHSPPEVGAHADRVPRQESYVKDFKPMRLGRVRLQKGTGQIQLRATELPGHSAMDFRLLLLRRLES